MKVWSRGLGKQALSANWFQTDLSVEGNNLVAKGIVRDKGIIWDCQFTFSREDIPGLLYMILSIPLIIHIIKNVRYVLMFPIDRLIKGGAHKERPKDKPKGSS